MWNTSAREDTCAPKEIARHLLTTENSVSSQLKKLLELGYVLRSPRGRESLYELAEPLMRLASEVKDKRRKPLRLLVNFLRIWYRPDVLPQLLAKAGTPSLRVHLQAAISQSRSSPDPRLKVLDAEIEKAVQENRLEDLLLVLEELGLHPRLRRRLVRTCLSSQRTQELGGRSRVLRQGPGDRPPVRSTRGTAREMRSTISAGRKPLWSATTRPWGLTPGSHTRWNGKGMVLDNLGRQEAALECYDKALGIDPRYTYVWNGKGNSRLTISAGTRSLSSATIRPWGSTPRFAYAWNGKGNVLYNLGRHGAALECYDKALGIDPRYTLAWNGKGNALNNLGRQEVALECYDKALGIDPRFAVAWSNKGNTLSHLGRHEAALECYDKALGIDPRFAVAWSNKGDTFSHLGRQEVALECYDKALEIDPRFAFAWSNKGNTLSRLGRPEACARML